MDYAKESLKMHYDLKGKIEVVSRAKVDSKDALSLAYTPGVAQPCLEIQKDVNKSYDLTRRSPASFTGTILLLEYVMSATSSDK